MARKRYLKKTALRDARELFLDRVAAVSLESETLPVSQALNRITAEPVFARRSSPHYHGSAMDGICVRAEDASGATEISGTSVLTASHVREHALIVDGSAVISPNGTDFGASRVNTLTIDGGNVPTGKLDLNDNDLMVDYAAADEPTPAPTMQSQIAFARHGGSWDRSGITSSAAASHPSHATTLGILEGSSFRQIYGPGATFSGQSVDDTSVLVKYTWYGDSDFNGKVNFDDYVRTDNGFNNHLTGWLNGDFDLNGQVNFDDYVLIDLAFNTQSGTLGRALAFLDGSDLSDRGMDNAALRQVQAHVAAFGADYAGHLLAAVPEPAGSALVVVGLSIVALPRMRRGDRSI